MNARVLQTLEYDRIREKLATHATSPEGAARCLSLTPAPDASDARRALLETSDAAKRYEKKGRLSFSALKDFQAELRALTVGATLEMKSLLALASFFENVTAVRAFGKEEEKEAQTDSLSDYFLALTSLDGIAEEIRHCIISEDEMAPDASPALKQIKRQIQLSQEKIRDELNKMVNGSARAYLQDAVITMRGDRYCLPVRAEHKARVKGMVHDRSKGGSTLFIEPEAVVDLNNRLRELAIEEEQEIARILASLSAMCAEQADAIADNVKYMALLDFIFAKAKYGLETSSLPCTFSEDHGFSFKGARHPLIDKDRVVPIDIRLGGDKEDPFRLLVITGPNTGGKTVTLKTAGLLTLMAMSGMMIPAEEGSSVAFFEEIYADIGDEQSIEQSLSTFSSHMTQIVRILQEADENSLCLFDELGAGTDPTEGAALAISVLNHLLQRGCSLIATTHYAELKVFAMTTDLVKNASCAFDVETLRPTYRLLIGTPGASNAFAISRRLGLPEEIIRDAAAQIDSDKARMEHLFEDLEKSRKTVEEERIKIDRYKEEQAHLTARLKEQEEAFDTLGDDILKEAHEKAEEILAEAKRFADETIRVMRKGGADPDILADLERERTRLNEKLAKARGQQKAYTAQPKEGGIRKEALIAGDRVRILSNGLRGIVKTLPDKDGKLTVTCGVMQVETHLGDLVPDEEEAYSGKEIAKRFSMKKAFADRGDSREKRSASFNTHPASHVSAEINLIGKNTDDAIMALDKYLDDAYLTHLSVVRIVHGKGTGTLRSAVQKHLKSVKYVKSFQSGAYGEGDAGVTIVRLQG